MRKIVLILVFITLASIACRSQNVTILRQHVYLYEVLKEVEVQTSYKFVNMELLQNKIISMVNINSMPVLVFLKRYLGDNYLVESTTNKLIRIIRHDESFSLPDTVQNINDLHIKAKITDKMGTGLYNVNVTVVGINKGTRSDSSGFFELYEINENAELNITHIGYAPITVKAAEIDNKTIKLELATKELNPTSISVAHTGLQSFPLEKTAGSYVTADTKKINRSISTNILDRLPFTNSGVLGTPDPDNVNNLLIRIRGISTINANAAPLIIVDNFRFTCDINTINPNDVESITILKDAAATSIYGAAGANGVIVITTRKAKNNQPFRISLNTNVTVSERPNLFKSRNYIQAKDLVNLEIDWFNKGYSYPGVPTPVTEILLKKKNGSLSEADATKQLEALKTNDAWEDLENYFLQKSVNQQYAMNMSYGGAKNTYNFSAGFDNNRSDLVYNGYKRVTLSTYNTFMAHKKLEIHIGANYAGTETKNNNGGKGAFSLDTRQLPSYVDLVDNNGNALPVTKDLAQSVKDSFTSPKPATDWDFKPYDEIKESNNKIQLHHFRVDLKTLYKLGYGFQLETDLQYLRQTIKNRNLLSSKTYYTRNLINTFYNPAAVPDEFRYPVPPGDILDENNFLLCSYQARVKVNFERTFHDDHSVKAILACDMGKATTDFNARRIYRYQSGNAAGQPPADTLLPTFHNIAGLTNIPHADAPYRTIDEYNSFLANASYTYLDRYNIYGSFRFDRFNIYGTNTNRQWLPLLSIASYWILSKEKFFNNIGWVKNLKLKASLGRTGNAYTGLSALQTISIATNPNNLGYNYSTPNNPPNPDLGSEKTIMGNVGLEFDLFDGRLTGSAEFYTRKGTELIGPKHLAPSAGLAALGVPDYLTNNAAIKGHGVDFKLASINTNSNTFKWTTDLLFNLYKDKVVSYDQTFPSLTVMQASGGLHNVKAPVAGKPTSAIFSYNYAGVDPNNGDPQGYKNGLVSKSYDSLLAVPLSEAIYNGPGTPVIWGSILNTFTYKNLTLSFNIVYKLGYFFRATTISYYALLNAGIMHTDYYKKYDPNNTNTNVPSADYSVTSPSRDNFFAYSKYNIHKADHVRFQDIQIGYNIANKKLLNIKVTSLQLYMCLNNLGVIWRANKSKLDPDFPDGPLSKTMSAGIKVNI